MIGGRWRKSEKNGWWYRQDGECDVIEHSGPTRDSRRPWVIRLAALAGSKSCYLTGKGGRFRGFASAESAIRAADKEVRWTGAGYT